jgi:hypothetical protein
VIVYIIRTYFRDYPNLLLFIGRIKFFALLRQLWAALWSELRGAAQAVRDYVPTSLPKLRFRRAQREPNRYIHLSTRTPREQIYYYYLSTLRRTAEQGLPRSPEQTPYEYEHILELPEAKEAFDTLTQAFVEARYSTSPIDMEHAKRIRAQWREVRRAIQQIEKDRRENADNLSS